MFLNLIPNPLDIELSFRPRNPALRQLRAPAVHEQRLGDFTPIAIHHVRLVELDLEEERRARCVRRPLRRVRLGGDRGGANDEALERLVVP